jgi:8-oxo-dGTP diphosphatase
MIDMQDMIVVVKGLIVHNGKLLIVKRSTDDEVGAGTWECVGGQIEFGENLEDALIREVKEEVSLAITVDQLIYATTFQTSSMRQVVILSYICEPKTTNVILSKEHNDYCWAPKSITKTLLAPNILEDFNKNKVFDLLDLD